jgi:hypothetical protein
MRLAQKLRQSRLQELVHYAFRLSEIVCRLTVLTLFSVLIELGMFHEDEKAKHQWLLLVGLGIELLFTMIVIVMFGGRETRSAMGVAPRLLIGMPCLMVNLFLFVDSPYKQRAARNVSRWLQVRNFVSPVLWLMTAILVWGSMPTTKPSELCAANTLAPGLDCFNRLVWDYYEVHSMGASISILCWVMYLPLLFVITRQDKLDIFTAAETGKEDVVEQLLKGKDNVVYFDINRCDADGCTALMYAVRGGHLNVVQVLLQNGASVDVRTEDSQEWTAVHYAAAAKWHEGSSDILRELLDHTESGIAPAIFMDAAGNTPCMSPWTMAMMWLFTSSCSCGQNGLW